MARILWRDAQGKEGSIELSSGEVYIGRAMDCAIRTDDAMVSRRHARLYWAGDQYHLEDLGSANGVFYQEQRVTRHPFKHGDAVRCGSLWLRFVDATPGHKSQPVPGPGIGPAQPQGVFRLGDNAATPVPVITPPSGPAPQPPVSTPMQPLPNTSSQPVVSDSEEVDGLKRHTEYLERRIEQLETHIRLYENGQASELIKKIDTLQEDNQRLRKQRNDYKKQAQELQATLEHEGGDAKVQKADNVISRTTEIVQQLNDLLSNLRPNVMAAEDEFEQYAHNIPRASFELIREALRSSSNDVDKAREILRELRDIGD